MESTVLSGALEVIETHNGKELRLSPHDGKTYLIPMGQEQAENIGNALIDRVNPVGVRNGDGGQPA